MMSEKKKILDEMIKNGFNLGRVPYFWFLENFTYEELLEKRLDMCLTK